MDDDSSPSHLELSSSDSSLSLHTIPDDMEFSCFNYVDPATVTGLTLGSVWNNIEIAEESIKAGREINLGDNNGNTALHHACINGSMDVLRLLLRQPTVRVDVMNHVRDTPLHHAIRFNENLEMVKLLVEAGCDVNQDNNDLTTPLLEVCLKRKFPDKIRMAVLLLEHGADVHEGAMFIMHQALRSTYFAYAFTDDFAELLAMFEYYGADFVSEGESGESVIMLAVEHSLHNVLYSLFDYEDDFNRVMPDGYTMFMKAIAECNPTATDMLDRGGDINYCWDTESCLSLSMNYFDPKLFLYIWNSCDKSYVLGHHNNFLKLFLESDISDDRDDFIKTIYVILDSEVAHKLIADAISEHFYMHLITRFKSLDVAKSDRLGIIYTLLTINNYISMTDLLSIYDIYGFNEEFEAFLIVNVVIKDFHNIPHVLTQICYPQHTTSQFTEPISLQERSRDVIRQNLHPRHKMGTSHIYFQYYNKVQRLMIPKPIKDMICFKSFPNIC